MNKSSHPGHGSDLSSSWAFTAFKFGSQGSNNSRNLKCHKVHKKNLQCCIFSQVWSNVDISLVGTGIVLFPGADKPHMILQSSFHVEGLGALGAGQPHPLVVTPSYSEK